MTNQDEPRDRGSAEESLEPALEELRNRLAADVADVMRTVAGLSQSQADWTPGPDRWSVGEVLHHLAISNRMFAVVVRRLTHQGRHKGLVAGPESRRSWPRLRSFADSGASGPVRNPESATPTAGLPIGELRDALAAAHAAVEDQIPALAGLDLAALHMPHPLGFELNLYHWADIAGAHERRHLAQIRAIMADPNFPPATK